jgi:hypothetical protein
MWIDHTVTTDDYVYDIFVSYKREPEDRPLVTPWIQGVLDRVEHWVTQELGGRKVNMFFDRKNIKSGVQWKKELGKGLLRSKCMLAILSSEYFQSSWCLAEWRTFLARQQITESPLIVPIKYTEEDWFPEEAQDIEWLDLADLTGTTEAFWKTERADKLDQKLKEFAPALANIIEAAPSFQADWPIREPEPPPPPRRFLPMSRL